jgi:hypothetical protein
MVIIFVYLNLQIDSEERPAGKDFRCEVGHFTLRPVSNAMAAFPLFVYLVSRYLMPYISYVQYSYTICLDSHIRKFDPYLETPDNGLCLRILGKMINSTA